MNYALLRIKVLIGEPKRAVECLGLQLFDHAGVITKRPGAARLENVGTFLALSGP